MNKWKTAPRYSWSHYGIDEQRKKELIDAASSGKYASLTRSAAHRANEDIEEYILLSAEKKLSYERLQMLWDLRIIPRMTESRTNFYAWRRYFFSIFDQALKEKK